MKDIDLFEALQAMGLKEMDIPGVTGEDCVAFAIPDHPEFPEWWSPETINEWLAAPGPVLGTSYTPCCRWARRVHCVCSVSYLCPTHGSKCHGTHD